MLLMDSGCDMTLVKFKLVLSSDFVADKTVDLHQVDSSRFNLPLADVNVLCELYGAVLRVGVLDSFPGAVC